MPQFDSHLACFGCRAKCKGQDPCAQGAKVNQCAACSTLSEQQWTHLRESFAKRSSYSHHTGSHDDNLEPETDEELVFTGEELGQVDDTLLHLEPEQIGHWHQSSQYPNIICFFTGDEFPGKHRTGTTIFGFFFSPFQGAGSGINPGHYLNRTNTKQTGGKDSLFPHLFNATNSKDCSIY